MKRSLVAMVAIATAFASTLIGAAPAQAAAASCTVKVNYDIDANGNLNFHPVAVCDGATLTLAIYAFSPSTGTESVLYTESPAGSYAGTGLSIPYAGPGEYCITTDVVWTALAIGSSNVTSKNCVTR